MDPDNLPEGDLKTMNFGSGGNTKAKAWKDIWGSGQGIGSVSDVRPVADFVEELSAQYRDAYRELQNKYIG
jgi:nitronate monooxygenase